MLATGERRGPSMEDNERGGKERRRRFGQEGVVMIPGPLLSQGRTSASCRRRSRRSRYRYLWAQRKSAVRTSTGDFAGLCLSLSLPRNLRPTWAHPAANNKRGICYIIRHPGANQGSQADRIPLSSEHGRLLFAPLCSSAPLLLSTRAVWLPMK